MEKTKNDFGIDMDEITGMIDDLKRSNKSGSKSRFTPPKGTSVVRIVPYEKNHKNPFVRMYFHWNIGKGPMLSPTTYGRPDPIQEASVKLLEKAKETQVKDDWKLGKRLEPSLRVYVPVLVRDAEDQGVKWWGFGKEIFAELLDIIKSGDYDDITHPKEGHDIKIERKTKEEAGNDYGKTTIRVLPQQTPISKDVEIFKKSLIDQPDITELYPEPTYDELKDALNKYLNPEDEVNDVDETEDTISESESITSETSDKATDAMSQFDDVLNQIQGNKG